MQITHLRYILTRALQQIGWDNLSLLASERPPELYERAAATADRSGKLAVEATLRRLLTLGTDSPDWASVASSMTAAGHPLDDAACKTTWLDLMQRKPPGSLPADELEKRFWTFVGRRVDLLDGDCWCSGVTAPNADALAGCCTIDLDNGETVTISVPDKRVRYAALQLSAALPPPPASCCSLTNVPPAVTSCSLSLLFPPSSTLERIQFLPDAVRTAADVTLATVEGNTATKYCSLRDLVLLLRGRQESKSQQQPIPAMASDEIAEDLVSMLHPSEVIHGVAMPGELNATVISRVCC